MVKKNKLRIFGDIVLLIVTLLFAVFLIRSILSSLIASTQPFISNEGHLEADTNTYVLRPTMPGKLYDGLDFDQYIEGQYTVLGLGMDEDGLNTDVMMLFIFDINAAKINILQIPRDSYVGPEFTNSEVGKINSVYSQGTAEGSGINKVVKCVRDLVQIPIDSYIAIKCTDVAPVVDAMDGIPMNVPDDIIYEHDKIIEKGQHVLTGEQSEWFVRYRHDFLEGDIGRMKAQRFFLAAAFQKVQSLGTLKILSIYPTLQEYIMSDLTIDEIGMLCDFAQTVTMDNVMARMIPGEEILPGEINEQYGWSLHREETADILNEFFRPYQEDVAADSLKIPEVKNTVSYYENDGDNFGDIISGKVDPVTKREDANSLLD